MENQIKADKCQCSLFRDIDGELFIRRYTSVDKSEYIDYEIYSSDIDIIICDPHIVFREDHENKKFSIDDSDEVLGIKTKQYFDVFAEANNHPSAKHFETEVKFEISRQVLLHKQFS